MIGYANQFVVESGGDFSVTNSNSNFGQTTLYRRVTKIMYLSRMMLVISHKLFLLE